MAAEVLVEHGAFIDKYIGDSVMAFFNVPIRAADHAARAVAAAVRIQQRMSGLGQHFEIPLRATVGIASGWARVGRLGPSQSQDFTAIGDAVNVASRLQAQAGPNEILMDGNVYRQVSLDFPAIEAEQLTLKGFLHLIEAYRLGSGTYRDRSSAPKREARRTFHVGSLILAWLGAPCAGAVLLGPIATFVGIGSVLSSTSSYWIFDSPFLRIPALGLSATGALVPQAAFTRACRTGSLHEGQVRPGGREERMPLPPACEDCDSTGPPGPGQTDVHFQHRNCARDQGRKEPARARTSSCDAVSLASGSAVSW